MQPQFRSNSQRIGELLVGTPTGQQIPLKHKTDGSLARAGYAVKERMTRTCTYTGGAVDLRPGGRFRGEDLPCLIGRREWGC